MYKCHQSIVHGVMLSLYLGLTLPVMAQQATIGKTDAAFLNTAAERQQSEIQLGQLAVERAESEQVKQFAQRMVQDHTKASQEISNLATTIGITLSETKGKGDQQHMGKLSSLSGPQFDRAYVKHEMSDHKKTVSEFAAKSKALKNPQIRAWASATLPMLKEHLSLANGLASKPAKAGAKKTGTQG
jgi:putative membrane protein